MLKALDSEAYAEIQRNRKSSESPAAAAGRVVRDSGRPRDPLLPSRGKARSAALISAAQLRQSGPWAARQHYNAAKLLVRVVCAAAQLRAVARAPQSPPIAISGCKRLLAKSAQV
eukprot:COSAG06_NODE_2855_length_6169_cov_7.820264_11_plen_115_part_00